MAQIWARVWAECELCLCASAQVQKHLSKLFDNMAKMRFEADEDGNPSKTGLGMYSKEDEYVPFNEPCDCTGQVKYTHLSAKLNLCRCTKKITNFTF